jgi:TolB-like protein/Tfp pilus assembly protein PilF
MPSLIPGYEYDIFISYRQKDNKYDGWVTEFVDNLKKELEATFKEEISVYFDINPHDGLLETHDVDASLEEKLKCLIFIPIISRTYCDPKSFAWEHEFKTFVEQASQDQFGLKIKLSNGNVASRVLPIQIHEIATDDKAHIERELGGILRPIEFIYKEPGVNRPLRGTEDHPNDNLNKTFYRNQINKVANAIDEIINSLKNVQAAPVKEETPHLEALEEVKKEQRKKEKDKSTKIPKRRLLSGITILVVLIFAAVIAYPKIFKKNTLEKLRSSGERISVAVMPFQNMTNDTTWNVWQDGIQNELITSLTNSEELKVRQTESTNGLLQSKGLTNYASITPSIASIISQKLNTNVFIYGSIKQVGKTIRVNAQLIDSKTEEVFKSFQIDGTAENILHMIDSLSGMAKNFLVISIMEKETTPDFRSWASTNSPEAYRYFIYGNNAFNKYDMPTAIKLFLQALAIDSNFNFAALRLASAYSNLDLLEEGKKWCLKVYKKREQMPMQLKLLTDREYSMFFETPYEEIKYFRQLQEIDDQLPMTYYGIGRDYLEELYQFDKAIPEFEKALEIYNKWGTKPSWVLNYIQLGRAYHKTGQYKKEKDIYKKAEQDFPDHFFLLENQAILSLTEGDTVAANRYIEKYKTTGRENSWSDADITTNLAQIYSEAGIMDKAEEYYRQALSLEPENPVRMNALAYFLIYKDRNINEGLELVERALKLQSDNYNYLHTKGWGFFKQGKYTEALEVLQKSWDVRRDKAIYNHEAFLHLEAAKKAVASQKNN